MTILTGDEIKKLNIVQPCLEETRINKFGKPGLSFGCGSMGYDIRLSSEILEEINAFDSFENIGEINCKTIKEKFERLNYFNDSSGEYFLMRPNSTCLGISVEEFNIPDNVMGVCYGKSTYARSGIGVNVTPLEPGWRGRLVIEIINHTGSFNRVYANEGIAQILFFKSDKMPSKNYRTKNGKYQNQQQLTYSKV